MILFLLILSLFFNLDVAPSLANSKFVLRQADNIDNGLGAPDWRLALCLLVSWAVICLTLIKGVKSSGKVSIASRK